MDVINLTPHWVNIYNDKGGIVKSFPPSEFSVRVDLKITRTGEEVNHVPLSEVYEQEIMGLPSEEEGFYYIVSLQVREACPCRRDLLVPTERVFDGSAAIGCKSLSRRKV